MTIQPSEPSTTITGEWECTECGYIEEGAETHRPDQCPECDAPSASMGFYAYEDDGWEDDDQVADMDELGLLDTDEDEEFEDEEDEF